MCHQDCDRGWRCWVLISDERVYLQQLPAGTQSLWEGCSDKRSDPTNRGSMGDMRSVRRHLTSSTSIVVDSILVQC